MKLTRLLSLSTAVLALLVCGMLGHITRNAWLRYDATDAGLQALRLTRAAMVAAENCRLSAARSTPCWENVLLPIRRGANVCSAAAPPPTWR